MSLDRTKQFIAEGFEFVAKKGVALPHTVWKIDMDVEFNRELRLAEETVLNLVAAGVTAPAEIESLMGLARGVIVPSTIVNLLRKGLLSHLDQLALTPLGQQALNTQTTRGERKYEDVHVEHDPYRNQFRWRQETGEIRSQQSIRDAGLHSLPNPLELAKLDVETRHREIQEIMDRFGLPFDKPDERWQDNHRDILRLTAVHSFTAWREAELEIWHNREADLWRWRLLYQGGEDRAISDALERLEKEGTEIYPLETIPKENLSEEGERLHEVVEQVQVSPRTRMLETEQHRSALHEAIRSANRELIIVSPWLHTHAVDEELLGWLRTALDQKKELRVIIGYGIEPDDGKSDRKARIQREALARLNQLGNRKRSRLRTVEIGNTHEKLVICDGRYAIVTSFNFLSFNPKPGKGLRREMGFIIDNPEEVVGIRASLASVMKL